MTERLYVFCYDISDSKKRRRVAKRLEDIGVRVQYSVFEARMTEKLAKKTAAGAARHLGPGDSLKVYAIGSAGLHQCMAFGSALQPQSGSMIFV